MATITREELASAVGEGIHTALRKAGRSRHATAAYRAIDEMNDEEWGDVVDFAVDGLASLLGLDEEPQHGR